MLIEHSFYISIHNKIMDTNTVSYRVGFLSPLLIIATSLISRYPLVIRVNNGSDERLFTSLFILLIMIKAPIVV